MDEQKLKFDNEIKKHEHDKLQIQQGNMILKLYYIMYYILSEMNENIGLAGKFLQ